MTRLPPSGRTRNRFSLSKPFRRVFSGILAILIKSGTNPGVN
jgi:hypothetical protein